MTTQTVFELIEAGRLKEAAKIIESSVGEQPPSLQVARCLIDLDTGASSRARTTAEKLLKSKLSEVDAIACWAIVGRVAFKFGELEEGHRAFKKAFEAVGSRLLLETRLRARYAQALVHFVGVESATLEIPKLRRLAVQSGDHYSLLMLHTVVAEIHTKEGSLAAAKASIAMARSILQQYENPLLQGWLAALAAALAILQSDYESAITLSAEVLDCVATSGASSFLTPGLANIAHVRYLQGRLEDAKTAIGQLKQPRGGAEIAVITTEMQVALACGDLEEAKVLDEQLSTLSANLADGYSYYGLWHRSVRVKWLYLTKEPQLGLNTALDAIPHAKRTADRHLIERIQLLAAEGFGRVGQPTEGASLMAEAVNANADPRPELIAEAWRVAGRLSAPSNPAAARDYFERAARVFREIGNLTAHAEVQRDASETLGVLAGAQLADQRPAAAPYSERIAALVELGSHPPLLAAEAVSLLIDTGAVVSAVTAEQPGDDAPERSAEGDASNTVRIPIGEYRDRHYIVAATPKDDAAARGTVLAVERLIQASVSLAGARQDQRERAALWADRTPEQQLGLVCASERMLEIVKVLRRVADSNLTVLLTGETGVGKEVFARALHLASARKDRTFLPFNCTAVPRDMLDSQLFGHRRGAFTGALEEGKGVIRAAAGSTLFLDEIGELSMEAQPKLLRFLESGEILPLGETRPIEVDARIVAATNANLEALVEEGRFREDLFYRLNVLPIHIPPLRERREEIPVLVQHFLERYGRELQKPMLRVADETLEYLLLHRWPGNVRQLANEIRRMVALAEPGGVLQPADLAKDIIASRRTIPVQPSEAVLPLDQPLDAAIEQLERAVIERALKVCNGRNDEAAKKLGLSRKGLYLKRQRLGI